MVKTHSKAKPRRGAAPKRAKGSDRSSSAPQKSKAIVKALTLPEKIEQALIAGDLTPLTAEERVTYYNATCKSLGLNPLTQPFGYIAFKETENAPAKLVLYAKKDCTEQLRKIHGVAVCDLQTERGDGIYTVKVMVKDRTGKTDFASGVVSLTKWKDGKIVELGGKELSNALMRAETKAKRRASLSICGLGILDESELDTVDYGVLTPGGRVMTITAEPDVPRIGSVAAAQEVAQRKIAEHAAKQPPPADPNKVLFWAKRSESMFYLWGYTAEVQPLLNSKEVMAAQSDGKWIVEKGGMSIVKAWAAEHGHVLQEGVVTGTQPASANPTLPKAHIPNPDPVPKQPESAPAKSAESSGRPGVIEKVEKGTSKNGEFRKVFWNGDTHSTWDKKLFPYLDKAVGKGAEFLTMKKGQYSNIVSAKWIAETEFDEEGQPVIQRGRTKENLFDEEHGREPGLDG